MFSFIVASIYLSSVALAIELDTTCLAVAKAELCIDFFRDELDYCMAHLKPFYNKVSRILFKGLGFTK